jgi:hypothetical protein
VVDYLFRGALTEVWGRRCVWAPLGGNGLLAAAYAAQVGFAHQPCNSIHTNADAFGLQLGMHPR